MVKKYINDSHKSCYILSDFSNDEELKYEPSEYWILFLYIITLKDHDINSPNYLVLEYPSYTDKTNNGIINDCIWSVPYMAYLCKKEGIKRYTMAGDIKNFYKEQLQKNETLLSHLENYRFYHMGISNYDKEEGMSYIEYKKSTRQPDKWKCYYIREFYITNIDSLGLLNLADPEGLHNYRYYPLINEPNKKSDMPIRFLGKHLSTNIAYILRNSWNILKDTSNFIDSKLMWYKLNGLIFKLDIIGFTQIYNKISDNLGTLEESGQQLAKKFIAQISTIFEHRLKSFGISQYVIEGDGFTATFPQISGKKNKFQIIIALFEKIKKDLDFLVKRLDISIGIRCSVISGDYTYGKINGLGTLKQNFSGEALIVLSRIDEYLKKNSDKSSIIIGIGEDLYECYKDLLISQNYVETLEPIKEYRDVTLNAIILKKE